MIRKYLDFSLGLESAAGGGYRVRAFSRSAEAESVVELPFEPGTLNGVLGALESGSTRVRDLAGPGNTPQTRLSLSEFGRTLFAALFPGEVGELYASEWTAATKAGLGIRLRLHLRPRNPELAWLSRIPWELIFDERAGGFPCLNPLNPLVRHLDVPRPVERMPFLAPTRVLVAAANPSGLPFLDLKEEQRRIGATQGRRRIEVKVLEKASPEELRRELSQGGYQIVHFMGHGLVDVDQGSLIFSTPEGRTLAVSGSEMLHLLQGIPTLPLVILNACRTAAVPLNEEAEPLAGVAAALVRGGIPAVVGMQFSISDSAAITFSQILYERLAGGEPIEAAVAEGRLAIFLANPHSLDWSAPVLFLRGAETEFRQQVDHEKRSPFMKKKPTQIVSIEEEVIRAEGDIDMVALDHSPGTGIDHSSKLSVKGRALESGRNLTITAIRSRETK